MSNFDRYQLAFVHKSKRGEQSYERVEFLGDSVINLIVTKYLFDKFPYANEGFLTRVRTKLVSGTFLAKLSQYLGLNQYVVMNQLAIDNGWYNNKSILEDVFESLICCIYLDKGMLVAKEYLLGLIEKYCKFEDMLEDTNYKDTLMRVAQTRGMHRPEFAVLNDPHVSKTGEFEVVVLLDGKPHGRAGDVSKKTAEQKAAKATLKLLGIGAATIL